MVRLTEIMNLVSSIAATVLCAAGLAMMIIVVRKK